MGNPIISFRYVKDKYVPCEVEITDNANAPDMRVNVLYCGDGHALTPDAGQTVFKHTYEIPGNFKVVGVHSPFDNPESSNVLYIEVLKKEVPEPPKTLWQAFIDFLKKLFGIK